MLQKWRWTSTAAAVAVLASTLGLAAVASAQITNGSFESGLTGWTVVNPSGSAVGTASGQGRTDGTIAAAFNSGNLLGSSSISQAFATTTGTRYVLQYDYGVFGPSNPTSVQNLNANVTGGSTLVNQTVSAMSPGSGNQVTWTRYHVPFVANSGSTSLTFTDNTTLAQSASADGMLDRVSVTATGANVISPGGNGSLGTVNYLSGIISQTGSANGPVTTQTDTRVGSGCNAAGCATDGNTNGSFVSGNSTTHTLTGTAGNTWQVTMGNQPAQPNSGNHQYAIDHITIFNRSDCCQDRLTQFNINLLNPATGVNVLNPFNLGTDGDGNSSGVSDNAANAAQAYPQYGLRVDLAPNTIGKTVQVVQNVARVLSLAEVQVQGEPNMVMGPGDQLLLEFSASGNDFVNVQGNAVLGDVLMQGLAGYVPTMLQAFNVLTAANIDISNLSVTGFEARIISGGNGQILQLVAAPEPASVLIWCAVAAVAGTVAWRCRRKTASA